MNQIATSQTKNSRYQIHLALVQKYDTLFNRFRMGPLHYILYNYTQSAPALAYKDTALIADDAQWLRRQYRELTVDGSEEIRDRIQLLTQHYNNKKDGVTFEYPTMFLTKTQKIFKARLRMKQKMKPIDLSSDYQPSSSTSQELSQSSIFLRSLEKSNLSYPSSSSFSSKFIKSICLQSENNIEYSLYNIYESEKQEQPMEIDSSRIRTINFRKQLIFLENIDHLVCDFDDYDEEYLQKQIQIKAKNRKENTKTAIQIVQIKDEQQNESIRQDDGKKMILNENRPRHTNLQSKRKQVRGHLKDRFMNRYLTTKQRDLEQTQRNKGMIRKKAQNLLKKLQDQDYINYTIPYDEE